MRGFSITSFRHTLLRISPLLLFLVLFQLFPQSALADPQAQITDYRVLRAVARDASGRTRLAIRSFNSDGVAHLLLVDPVSFRTSDLPASGISLSKLDPEHPAASLGALDSTPFMRALARYDSPPYPLQNGGAIRADAQVAGSFLTVDLCPSKRPFERELFDTLAAMGKGAPVPVAVMVTGVWLGSHPEELSYLTRHVAEGKLAITWVNHSFHHRYDPQVPLGRNFVLTPGTDFLAEVLDLEQLLLSRGLVPSPFFRFPGLVSDAATVKQLRELSLIPLGSDAWLAKGETPRKGSFILVHGNGNEPKGIKLLLPMLRGGELRLLPLPEAFGR
jgi:hypothetical protein